ncbi:universal stress protein [Streptomyces cavernicola]|uniref:Universal stress protein n=1 Tax=Streptomyces cavernicola TaxID=3043613 RepID=A0ABT6SF79_9ACTN|nr:universal stress protein [Streptomyces sp. B-S-A6]MDI3406857.1 universal stress protein [Streptomyces sp. B-S-A6]
MYRHLTAGVDGSPESLAAAAWAADEAVLRRLSLHLVHAEVWPPIGRETGPPQRAGDFEQQRRWSEEMLGEAAEALRERHPGLTVHVRTVAARPPAALAIEAGEAELLAIGSRGPGRIAGFFLESVGLAAVACAERPVVLVRAARPPAGTPPRNRTSRYRDVVVGVDLDRASETLLGFAFDVAARRDCTLRVVHSWPLSPALDTDPSRDADGRLVAAEVEHALAGLLEPWRQQFPTLDVVGQALVGPPGEQLAHCAADADLLVVGRRVRGSLLPDALVGTRIGAVTRAVIHHSPAPVAVVAHA